MTLERRVLVDGLACTITISDENQALSDALASGGAVLGICKDSRENVTCRVPYWVLDPFQIDQEFLEKVARRHLNLPWIIKTTPRLIIRELTPEDGEIIGGWGEFLGTEGDLSERDYLREYIRGQYGFFEYGIWAVTLRENNRLIGLSGITNVLLPDESVGQELGYQICQPYRKMGYGAEACRGILAYAWEELELPVVYVRTDASNEASVNLAVSLGFQLIQTDNESQPHRHLYAAYCP